MIDCALSGAWALIDETPPRAKNCCGYRRIAAEEGDARHARQGPEHRADRRLVWAAAFLDAGVPASCRRNPDVEWLIFTDAASPPRLPPNVRIVPMDADALNRRCAATLGFETHISASLPYKVCDLRPTFGLVFAQEIGPRDFWGHCDLDVVWGDIRAFMRPEILEGHDIVTSRVGRISGHFCLYRNRPEWQTLFREIPGVTRLAQDAEHRNIDEMQMTELLRSHQASRGARSLRRWGDEAGAAAGVLARDADHERGEPAAAARGPRPQLPVARREDLRRRRHGDDVSPFSPTAPHDEHH